MVNGKAVLRREKNNNLNAPLLKYRVSHSEMRDSKLIDKFLELWWLVALGVVDI